MTRLRALYSCGLLLTIVPAQIFGAQASKVVYESKPVTLSATIEAIDPATRTVTLKGPKGSSVAVKVSEAVQSFNRLKVGDQVSATYFEAIAASLSKPGDPAPSGTPVTTTARKDRKLGSETQRHQTIRVSIQAIDPSVPTVTVKGPSGQPLTVRVEDPKNLQGVKVGDSVDLTYYESLLVKVESLAKKN